MYFLVFSLVKFGWHEYIYICINPVIVNAAVINYALYVYCDVTAYYQWAGL